MAITVEIPGLGPVEFPDGMSNDQIATAIKTNILPTLPTESSLGKLARGTASLADTALDSVTGALDAAAYPLARAFGRTPDQATAETTSPKGVFGRAFGVERTPEYKQEASRQVMEYIAKHFSEGADAISAKTGLPKADVENMINSLMMGAGAKAAPYVSKAGNLAGQGLYAADQAVTGAAKATGRAVVDAGKAVAKAPGQMVQGALNVARSPDAPVASRVVPEPVIQQATSPVVPAPGSGTTPRPADIGPLGELIVRSGRGDVPVKGRGVEAATETSLRGWRDALNGNLLGKGGLQTAADLAGLMGVGVPFQGSLLRGALPIAKAMSPIKAVDVPIGEGRTLPGFQRPSGGTYVSAQDMRGAGPAPVAEGAAVAPSAAPVAPAAPGSIEAKLQQMRAQIAARGDNGQEAQIGKREAASQQREAKQQSIDQVISEWGNVDSPSRQGIPTQPVDAVDMDNRTRGAVALMKKLGGTLDEIPSMEWLRDHGISENTFIQRVAKNSGASAISKRQRGNPNILGMMTEDDLPGKKNPAPVVPEGEWMKYNDESDPSQGFIAGSQDKPLTPEQYDQVSILKAFGSDDMPYSIIHKEGDKLVREYRQEDGLRGKLEQLPDGTKIHTTHDQVHENWSESHREIKYPDGTKEEFEKNDTGVASESERRKYDANGDITEKLSQTVQQSGKKVTTDLVVWENRNRRSVLVGNQIWRNGVAQRKESGSIKTYPYGDPTKPIWNPDE